MFDFFDQIVGFFEVIWEVVVNTINSLVQLLNIVSTFLTVQTTLLPLLPSFLMTSVLIVIAIGTAKLIVGR